jgi:hypothetical protein
LEATAPDVAYARGGITQRDRDDAARYLRERADELVSPAEMQLAVPPMADRTYYRNPYQGSGIYSAPEDFYPARQSNPSQVPIFPGPGGLRFDPAYQVGSDPIMAQSVGNDYNSQMFRHYLAHRQALAAMQDGGVSGDEPENPGEPEEPENQPLTPEESDQQFQKKVIDQQNALQQQAAGYEEGGVSGYQSGTGGIDPAAVPSLYGVGKTQPSAVAGEPSTNDKKKQQAQAAQQADQKAKYVLGGPEGFFYSAPMWKKLMEQQNAALQKMAGGGVTESLGPDHHLLFALGKMYGLGQKDVAKGLSNKGGNPLPP